MKPKRLSEEEPTGDAEEEALEQEAASARRVRSRR